MEPQQPLLIPDQKWQRQLWYIAVVNVSVIALAYLLIWPTTPDKRRELWFYALAFIAIPLVGATGGPALAQRLPWKFSRYLLPPFCATVAALAVIWSIHSVALTIEEPRAFLEGFVVTWLLAALHVLLLRQEGSLIRAVEILLTVAGCLALLLLFDYRLKVLTVAHGPYLGPAVNVLHGSRVMLDVFSQYGMSYLVFALVIAWSHYSLPAVATLVSVFNVAYFGTIAFIAWKLVSHRAIPFLFVVAGVVAAIGNYSFNINYTPSVWGMRFLPLLLLLAVLIARSRLKPLLLLIIVPVASLWSAEGCLGSLCLIAGYLFVRSRASGASLPVSAWRAIPALGYVALPHLVVSAAALLCYGQLPDYRAYWELIWAYAGDYWYVPPEPGFRLGLLHVAAYTTVLSFGISARSASEPDNGETIALSCIAIVGVLQFAYFAGRSTTPLLTSVSLPLVVLIAYAFAKTATALSVNCRSIATISLFTGTVFVAGLITGSAWTKLRRPIDPRPVFPFESSNAHLLGTCLQLGWRNCSFHLHRIGRPSQPLNDEDHVGTPEFQQAREAYEAVKRLESEGARVHSFIYETPTLYFYLRRRLPWGLSNPINDGLAPTIMARVVKAAEEDVRDGDYLLVARAPPVERTSADVEIIGALRKKFKLCDEGPQDLYPSLLILRVSDKECAAETR